MDSMPGPLRHQPTGQPTTIITRCFLRFASWSLKGKMLALISVILVLLTVSLSVGFVRLSYEQAGRQNDERLQTALVSLDRDLTVRLRNERHQFNEFSNSRPNALLFQGMALTDYSDERQLILSHRLGEGLDADFLMAAYEVDGAMRMRHGFIRDGDHSGIFLTEKDRNIFYAKDSTGLLQEDEANAYRKGLLLRMQAFTEESHAVSSLLQGTNIGQAEVLSLETIDGELYLVSSRDYVSRFEDRSYRLEVGDSLGRYVSFTRIGPLLTKLADDLDMDMAIHRADGSHLPGYGHFGDLPAGAADLDNRKFDMNGGDGDRYDARTFPLVAIDYPAGVVATAGIHWSDTTEEIQDVLILFMVIAGASLLVTLPVGFIFLSRFIADPIRQLAGAAEHMGKGRWETELPPIRRNDEIGELHSAFGRMAADLGSMWADLQDKIGELARSEAGLREARDNLEVAVDERTAELHEAQQRLVALAHQAGRAEVASSVLHNVGNVLTTVVATHYGINKRFRNSRINILTQVGTTMDEQEDPYEWALAGDRGHKLIDLIRELSTTLSQEMQDHRDDINHLGHSVEYIREIVARQQSMATGTRLIERLDLMDLVNESLELCRASLHSADITVENHSVSLFCQTERHRVMQILSNFISNACDAMAGADHRVMTVSINDLGDEARIDICDSGSGFSKAVGDQLFLFGFTTKTDGHGIGLHSCIVEARSMGGTVTARSDGPGTGACFCLTLPKSPREEGSSTVGAVPIGLSEAEESNTDTTE